MIVCLCRGVSERIVRTAIAQGADSAEAVGEACGAGTGCGTCLEQIACLVEEHRCASGPPASSMVPAAQVRLVRIGGAY